MMFTKKTLAVAAALLCSGGTASAAVVITDWNTDNVSSVSDAAGAGTSTIYDRTAGTSGALTTGRITFDGDEAYSPGIKIINDDSLAGSNGSNCIMANSDSSCNGAKQSGKRFKFQSAGSAPIDLVFNVDKSGSFTNANNDGLYKVFQAFGNDTGKAMDSFRVSLGAGVGANFVPSTEDDGLSFVQSFGGKDPNLTQFSALFSNGLFGTTDAIHPLEGYFSSERTGFKLAFDGLDSFESTGMFGLYKELFGPMLSYDQLPQGYFFDDDGDAETDDVLIAHQIADGSWVQNRSVDADGNIGLIAQGNDGTAYATVDDLVAALFDATGFESCSTSASGGACLAGTDAIDDLAKFNLSFFIDPTGYTGDQLTLRFASSTVPEPGTQALLALALALGVLTRRRKTS